MSVVLHRQSPTLRPASLAEWLGCLGAGALLAAALAVAGLVLAGGPLRFGLLYVDAFGALLLAVTTFLGLTATLYSVGYIRYEVASGQITARQGSVYYLWFFLFLLTMVAALVVENVGFLWVALEATTLVSAVLVGFHDRKTAVEAAWKYVILCSAGIAFALLGIILLYFAAVRAGLEPETALEWSHLMAAASRLDPAVLRLAYVMVLVGFGTKAGLAPMHTWRPDAYSQAPSPVSAVLSGALLNVALYAVLRFHAIAVLGLGGAFPGRLLLAFGLISLAVGTPLMLAQRDFKRLLAYSSVEHVGVIAVGIGIGGPLALYGALLHMVGHSLTKTLLFLTAGNLEQRYHSYRMERIHGVVRTLPFTGPLLVLGVLAVTGLPPFNLFLSEFTILAAGFQSGHYWAMAGMLVAIALAFAAMLLHLREMALGEAPAALPRGEGSAWSTLPLLLPLAFVLLLGLWVPPVLSDALNQIVGLLGGALR